jgi:HAD superfamily hydrolase (TIGR01509 family)
MGVVTEFEKVIDQYRGTPINITFRKIEAMMGERLPDDFLQQYRDLIYHRLKTDIQPIPGVQELLEKIDLPFCVASGGPVEKIRLTLGTTQLLPYFEGKIFSSYVVQSWKPDPGLFLHAAEKMGFQPADCLVIEDSLDGVQAATQGGFDVMGFVPDRNADRMRGTKAIVFHSMEELYNLVWGNGY